MGQDQSRQITKQFSSPLNSYKSSDRLKKIQSVRHEGILKISTTPFINCHQIDYQQSKLFMENTKISLKDLCANKIRLRKTFSEVEVMKIIENVVFSLAYLEELGEPYPYLDSCNIYFTNGCFKILPPQVIPEDLYQTVRKNMRNQSLKYAPISPEMVIAIRCHEARIDQKQILYKGNTFSLGMILLEICTLKPSSECYDLSNYDILADVITERITEIQAKYSKNIARIVANMLDYDYEQRMTPKETSIWINRQFQAEAEEDEEEQELREQQPEKKVEEFRLDEKEAVSIAASRFIQEPAEEKTRLKKPQIKIKESTKSRVEIVPIEKSVKTQPGQSGRSQPQQNRFQQIKLRIQRQKLKKADEQKCRPSRTPKSGRSLSPNITTKSPGQKIIKNDSKPLPNPYLHADHLYQPVSARRENKPFIQKTNDNEQKYEQRYQYSKEKSIINELPTSQRDRSIDLKYKYNVQPQSGRMHYVRGVAREQREIREDRNEFRKNNHDYCPENNTRLRHAQSDIDYYDYRRELERRFPREHVNRSENDYSDWRHQQKDQQKALKQRNLNIQIPQQNHPISAEHSKNNKPQITAGPEMERIRKEIEKSKKIIEEVRKSEAEGTKKLIQF